MGIAVFEARDEAEARSILAADPAVTGGVFRGEIKPYRVSLMRK
jgi:hypothetical protein